ncbi:MAG: SpoIIE family protein phosphatase [Candidatus Latescibacterota bacterium]|nr:MAG: SpoIIE family protein phosphatase [Candidatus Latescibacterota bacterium]
MAKKKFFGQISQKFSSKPDTTDNGGDGGSLEALRQENLRLTRALEELSMLNELAREIGASRNTEAIMDRIIKRSLRAVHAEQAVITMVSEQSPEPMKTLVRAMVTSAEHEQFHLSQNLLGWMHLNKRPLLSNSPRTDDRFRGITWDDSIRSILCVPLMVKSELKGVLTAYNKKAGRGFAEDDQRLLAIIAMQSAQVIDNARLYEEQEAYMRMQEEVRLASRIQLDLLPKGAPAVPGYDIAGRSIPAQMVGGDYFDFIPLEKNQMVICLGDVSGKGLPASLLMANLQATLRGQSLHTIAVNERVERANRLLYRSTDPEKFATLFYGVLGLDDNRLTFSNAGHENPYLLRGGGETTRLTTGGTVLGVVDNFPYDEDVVALGQGDVLVVFSDGITEAFDKNEDQFGEDRLGPVLEKCRDEPADVIIDRIVEAVQEFAEDAPQADDLTLVVVKRVAS